MNTAIKIKKYITAFCKVIFYYLIEAYFFFFFSLFNFLFSLSESLAFFIILESLKDLPLYLLDIT